MKIVLSNDNFYQAEVLKVAFPMWRMPADRVLVGPLNWRIFKGIKNQQFLS